MYFKVSIKKIVESCNLIENSVKYVYKNVESRIKKSCKLNVHKLSKYIIKKILLVY